MKKFLENLFPIIREGKPRFYILCGLCLIFLVVYEKGKIEEAIIITLASLLPLAMLQSVRDDYLRYAQRNDPEKGRKTIPQFLIWACLHTTQGFNAFLTFFIFIIIFFCYALKKLTAIIS